MAKLEKIKRGQTVTEQVELINQNVEGINEELVILNEDIINNTAGYITQEEVPVKSVNNKKGDVSLSAKDVDAFPNSSTIQELDINNLKETGVYIGTYASNPYYLIVIKYNDANIYQELIGLNLKQYRRFTNNWSNWIKSYSNENPVKAGDIAGIELVDTDKELSLALLEDTTFVKSNIKYNPSTNSLYIGNDKFATESFVQNAVNMIKSMIVPTLPETGVENTIYFVPNTSENSDNEFNEYVFVNGEWEILGGTSIDLTPFLTIENADKKYATIEKLDEKVSKTTTINGKTLYNNITLTAEDVGALSADTKIVGDVVYRHTNADISTKLSAGEFIENDVVLAIDDGNYLKGHFYKYSNGTLTDITDIITDYVDLSSDQSIAGIKNFTGVLRVGGVSVVNEDELKNVENKIPEVDTTLSAISTNPVENKTITAELNKKASQEDLNDLSDTIDLKANTSYVDEKIANTLQYGTTTSPNADENGFTFLTTLKDKNGNEAGIFALSAMDKPEEAGYSTNGVGLNLVTSNGNFSYLNIIDSPSNQGITLMSDGTIGKSNKSGDFYSINLPDNNGTLALVEDLDAKQDTLNASQLQAVNSGATSTNIGQITTNKNDISDLKTNKASIDFVNSSISTNTATFKGTYNTLGELQTVTADANDYGFVISTDNLGNRVFKRYKYSDGSWVFEYDLNNSSFTAEQWSAINSGITSTLVGKITTNENDIDNLQTNKVDKTTTINGKNLSANITLNANDVGALPSTTKIPSIAGLASETYVNNKVANCLQYGETTSPVPENDVNLITTLLNSSGTPSGVLGIVNAQDTGTRLALMSITSESNIALSDSSNNGMVMSSSGILSKITSDNMYEYQFQNKSGTLATTDDIPDTSSFINKDVNNLTNYTLSTGVGTAIDLSIDTTNYKVTAQLKNSSGTVLSSDVIDLPLESVVVNGTYDATNKKVILTLQNGNTVEFSVADLVSGLASQSSLNTTNANVSNLTTRVSTNETNIAKKLDKVTYEYNRELAIGSTGKVLVGKFPMYDSNVTIEVSSTTTDTYNGTLVIATQNINDSHGGNYKANVYGDPTGTLSSAFVVKYPTNSRVFEVYCNFPSWSKNLIHIKAVALSSAPSNIVELVTTIPTDSLVTVNNVLLNAIPKIPTNYVTTDTKQNVTASKVFTKGIGVGLQSDDYWTITGDTTQLTIGKGEFSDSSAHTGYSPNITLKSTGELNVADSGGRQKTVAYTTDIPKLVTLTQAEYDALSTKDANTYYFIKEE